jgi:hypothetical protein
MPDTLAGTSVTPVADVEAATPVAPDRTMTIEERARKLTEDAAWFRNTSHVLNEDVADVHQQSFQTQLDAKTARLATQEPVQLLDQLGNFGFAWRDIARMPGITVPALRRWRGGELPTGENRRNLAQLLAFVQIIAGEVFEPASWMDVPISGGAPTTSIDPYAEGQLSVLFDFATGPTGPEAALDVAQPGWRERFCSD